MSAARPRLAFLALFGGATGIGFAPILVRLSETGPTATAFYRLLFALPLIWLWMGLEQRRVAGLSRVPSTRAHFGWLTLAGLLFAGDLSIWHWALQFTTVTNSTLITNVAPLLVTLGAWLFLREQITKRFVVGMLLALTGMVLLVGTSYSL